MPTAGRHRTSGHPAATLRRASWPQDLDLVRQLFDGYLDWLRDHRDDRPEAQARTKAGLDLVAQLIAGLPGAYGPPRGEVLLWSRGGSVVACGALRELEPGIGEIKRIFVRPDFRGKGFGQPFGRALIERARELGYRAVRVDTLPSMAAAIEFYQELGFRPTPSFWPHPAAGALFFEHRFPD